MTFNRRWTALLVAAWLLGNGSARAQFESGSSSSFGSSPGGASSSFSPGSQSAAPAPPSGDGLGTGSSFFAPSAPAASGNLGYEGFGAPATPTIPSLGPTGTTAPASGVPGASSTFAPPGSEGGPRPQIEESASFSLSSAYGQAAQTFTLGEGRLAKPRFEYGVTLSLGYDDNILATPTDPQGFPEITQEVLVDPGVPEPTFAQVPTFKTVRVIINGNFVNVQVPTGNTRTVVVEAARPPEFMDVVVQPEIPAAERIGSFFARTSANYEIQFATRRTVFTMDLRANADYYFDRPNDQTDLNGSFGFNFIRRITPRLQFSSSANLAYLSQPDVRRINTPTQSVGDYLVGSSKFDLSYRWSPRFTTVSSLSVNGAQYMEPIQEFGNYFETVFGTEARYLWSPRLTGIVEGRWGFTTYPNSPASESQTIYGLLGGEYQFSARLTSSLRAGLSQRTFNDSGKQSISPYMEATASWRLLPTAFVSWNTRFGFEEPPSSDAEVQSLRTGLSVVNAFSSRLRGSAGFTYIQRTTTYETFDVESTEHTMDANVGLQYQWSRRLGFNASYNFTNVFSTFKVSDYYRNRLFFGVEYSF